MLEKFVGSRQLVGLFVSGGFMYSDGFLFLFRLYERLHEMFERRLSHMLHGLYHDEAQDMQWYIYDVFSFTLFLSVSNI